MIKNDNYKSILSAIIIIIKARTTTVTIILGQGFKVRGAGFDPNPNPNPNPTNNNYYYKINSNDSNIDKINQNCFIMKSKRRFIKYCSTTELKYNILELIQTSSRSSYKYSF